MRLIEILCSRLRRTSEQIEDFTFLDLSARLAKALLRLCQDSVGGKGSNRIRLTQSEISQMVGVSRESTNKQLRDWQRRKWLKLERNCIVILAPDALEKIVDANVA